MRIKNAFKVLVSNFKLIYKASLVRIFFSALAILVAYLAISDHLMPIITHEATQNLIKTIGNLFTNFMNFITGGEMDTLSIKNAYQGFMDMLSGQHLQIFIASSEVFCIAFFLRVIYNMFEYAYAKVLNGFMSARSRFGFLSMLFSDFGRALAYSLLYVFISFMVEMAIIIIAIAILIGCLEYIYGFAIFLAIIFLVVALTFKRAVLSSFLPNIVVENMGVLKALAHTSPKTRKHFASLFGSYFFLNVVTYYVNVTFAIFTFLTGLAITLPVCSLYFTTVSIVDKYCCKGMRFYTEENQICSNHVADKGDSFINKM